VKKATSCYNAVNYDKNALWEWDYKESTFE